MQPSPGRQALATPMLLPWHRAKMRRTEPPFSLLHRAPMAGSLRPAPASQSKPGSLLLARRASCFSFTLARSGKPRIPGLPPLHPPAHRAFGVAFWFRLRLRPRRLTVSMHRVGIVRTKPFTLFTRPAKCVFTCVLSALKVCLYLCLLKDTETGTSRTQV